MTINFNKNKLMKKLTACAMAIALVFASAPLSLSSKNYAQTQPGPSSAAENKAEANSLLNRLYDINAMKKDHLSAAQKTALGKEVQSINKRLHDIGGGFYISAGAVILILILLLIFL